MRIIRGKFKKYYYLNLYVYFFYINIIYYIIIINFTFKKHINVVKTIIAKKRQTFIFINNFYTTKTHK